MGGAVCGPRDLLAAADPAQKKAGINMTGTLSGNPISAAAGGKPVTCSDGPRGRGND